MSSELKVSVKSPLGNIIFIYAKSSATGAHLRYLVQLHTGTAQKITLLFNGEVLNMYKTLGEQGVKTNTEFTYRRQSKEEEKIERQRRERLKRHISEISRECLRINDVALVKAESTCYPYIIECEESDDQSSNNIQSLDFADTGVANDVLPAFWESDFGYSGRGCNFIGDYYSCEHIAPSVDGDGWEW